MIVFETSQYGTLRVTNMIDIDGEETADVDLAVRVVCPLPNGEWLAASTCCGKLRETEEEASMAVKGPWQDYYNPQSGEYGTGYSGDLNKGEEREYEEGDAKVDATRKEFGKGIPAGTGPGVTSGHDLD